MAGSKPKKNKTKDKMKRQTNDLVTLSALANGESGSKDKDDVGSLTKWLETLQEGFTNLTSQKNDVPFEGELPKFGIKVIAGNTAAVDAKSPSKKK